MSKVECLYLYSLYGLRMLLLIGFISKIAYSKKVDKNLCPGTQSGLMLKPVFKLATILKHQRIAHIKRLFTSNLT